MIQTAGQWPWKSESAKECVTTHLPNQLALKMDGAGALHLYYARVGVNHPRRSRRAAVVGSEALGVSLGEAATGADLGGSSK